MWRTDGWMENGWMCRYVLCVHRKLLCFYRTLAAVYSKVVILLHLGWLYAAYTSKVYYLYICTFFSGKSRCINLQ